MAATGRILQLTDEIFEQNDLALDDSYTERVRQLGDSACKAGVEATIRYLSKISSVS